MGALGLGHGRSWCSAGVRDPAALAGRAVGYGSKSATVLLDDQPLGYSLDVGVDSHHYAPLAVEEIAAIMATRVKHFGS